MLCDLRNQFWGDVELASFDVYINGTHDAYGTLRGKCEEDWYAPADALCYSQCRLTTTHQVADFVSNEAADFAPCCVIRIVHIGLHVNLNLQTACAGQAFNRCVHHLHLCPYG
ncbi:MAG TPA: hypothetical protein EYP49_18490 [Anaerolineae bacterium]|nr:hypothetical protein [Anaerolineae bacterium]